MGEEIDTSSVSSVLPARNTSYIRRRLQGLSVERRLNLLFRLAIISALAVTYLGFAAIALVTTHRSFSQELTSIASVVGATSRAALAFSDEETGQRLLSGLTAKRGIVYAALFQKSGELLAEYGLRPLDVMPLKDGVVWRLSDAVVRVPIVLDGEKLGSIVIVSSLSSLFHQLFLLLLVGVGVLIFTAIILARISAYLQLWVSAPIASLSDLTRTISHTKDLSPRLIASGEDEIQKLFKGFNHMLSQLEERDRALTSAKERAEEATRIKSMFLATVSHELRTPIHAILGMTDEVLLSQISTEQRELLEIVKSAGKSLLFVINDILDFSAIEAGKLKLSNTEFEYEPFIKQLLQMFELSASRKELLLKYNVDPKIPASIILDPGRLSQILVNLVANALKFTPSGFVEVISVLRSIDQENHTASLQVSVVDSGIGIAEENLKTIFESFSKIRKDGDAIEGTGLGLAITTKLVELMGGWIWVESKIGEGTSFHFVVECAVPSNKVDRVLTRNEFDSKPLVRCKDGSFTILVAEDNAVNRQLAVRVLEKAGFKVLLAVNGKECVDVFHAQSPDLILMDLDMPVMDGMQATREIRTFEKDNGGHIPIIAFTASVGADGVQYCLDNGMDAFLPKPVDRTTLISTLGRFLDLSDTNQKAADYKSPPSS